MTGTPERPLREQSGEDLLRRIEQLECQLAGCMTAATGWAKKPPKIGDWGWSPAFQDVLELRNKYENLRKVMEEIIGFAEENRCGACEIVSRRARAAL